MHPGMILQALSAANQVEVKAVFRCPFRQGLFSAEYRCRLVLRMGDLLRQCVAIHLDALSEFWEPPL